MKRVTVYLPQDLHIALKHVAADEGRSVSDLLVEAGRLLLEGEKRNLWKDLASPPSAQGTTTELATIAEMLARQSAAIDAIGDRIGSPEGIQPDTDTEMPQAAKVAAAAEAVLESLSAVGEDGADNRRLRGMISRGITTGAISAATAALREGGVLRRDGHRWVRART